MFQLITNGLGGGSSMSRLIQSGMNPAVLRPWYEEDAWGRPTGRNFITVHSGQYTRDEKTGLMTPVMQNILTNAPAYFPQRGWLQLDQEVQYATRNKLQFYGDVYGANPYNIANGMGTIAIGDTVGQGDTEAIVSMDPIRRSQQNRRTFDTRQQPLPVIHSDGSVTARQLAVSAAAGADFKVAGLADAAIAVAEKVETLALGTAGTYRFGEGTLYGLLNHPQRMTKVLTRPDANGYTPETTINELLSMLAMLQDAKYNGPYVLYLNNAWNQYRYRNYSTTYPIATLDQRLREITQIGKVATLDFIPTTNFRMALVNMTDKVIQGVNGMPPTTIQWDGEGGMETSWKVMTINVVRIRTNPAGDKTGIVDGASA